MTEDQVVDVHSSLHTSLLKSRYLFDEALEVFHSNPTTPLWENTLATPIISNTYPCVYL